MEEQAPATLVPLATEEEFLFDAGRALPEAQRDVLKAACDKISESRQHLNLGDHKKSIEAAREAFALADDLYQSSDKEPQLLVQLAPHYYQLGNTIGAYVEDKTDVMGNLEDIGLEEDSSDEEEEEPADEENPIISEEPVAQPDREEEKIDTSAPAPPQQPVSLKEQWFEIALENLQTAQQLLEDYQNGDEGEDAKHLRNNQCINFMIKIYDRLGALQYFIENWQEALKHFVKVTLLVNQQIQEGKRHHTRLAVFAHF